MNTAVIIDDSERARTALKRDVAEYCQGLKIIGEADSVVSGLKLLKGVAPNIVFLDIHMGDGDGFDLLELLGSHNMNIIFTTSSDAHAIKAFKFSAVDYLLKPIDPDDLVLAVNKVTIQNPQKQSVELLKEQLNLKTKHNKIALATADKIQVFELVDIIRCQSEVNYTEFIFKDGKTLLITKTLKYFDQLLSDSGFYRVHQTHLINIEHIKEYIKIDGGYVVMKNEDRVPISSRKKTEVVKMISDLK